MARYPEGSPQEEAGESAAVEKAEGRPKKKVKRASKGAPMQLLKALAKK